MEKAIKQLIKKPGYTDHTESRAFYFRKNKYSEFNYYNRLLGNLIAVVTISLVLSYFISTHGTLVIWQKHFLQKLHFPQCVSIKCRPPAVNIIITNLNCNISQRFLCYISPKAHHVQVFLYKTGCEYSHHFNIMFWPGQNICSTTINHIILHVWSLLCILLLRTSHFSLNC